MLTTRKTGDTETEEEGINKALTMNQELANLFCDFI